MLGAWLLSLEAGAVSLWKTRVSVRWAKATRHLSSDDHVFLVKIGHIL